MAAVYEARRNRQEADASDLNDNFFTPMEDQKTLANQKLADWDATK